MMKKIIYMQRLLGKGYFCALATEHTVAVESCVAMYAYVCKTVCVYVRTNIVISACTSLASCW